MKNFTAVIGDSLAIRIIAFMAFCGVATWLLGKDSNWDILNYHLYVAHAFWANYDLQSDYMAAGLQRYFNPVGYLPFYLMVQAGWHSLLISLLLAAFHSFSLVILWEICARHLFKNDSRCMLLSGLSVALAAMSSVFIGTIGGSFLDPATMVLVFGAILLLCASLGQSPAVVLLPVLAGVLLGVTAGLKLTNLIFVASAGLALIAASGLRIDGMKTATWFGVGAAVGAMLSGGWWALQLYREFGNPFFPLFNDYFRSPDFPAVKLQLIRFKPATIVDALTFPFDMASSRMWVYAENGAADFRFALLAIFGTMLLAFRLLRRAHSAPEKVHFSNKPATFVTVFFITSFVLWVWTSGNGRYAVPVLLLVGPILVVTVRAAVPNWNWFAGLMLAIFSAQGVVVALSDNPRWDVGAWRQKWIDVEVPSKLKDQPYGYLTAGVNSYSFVALHIHPESRFVNLIGSFPLSLDGPGGHRVRAFISAHVGKLRMMGKLDIPIEQALAGTSVFNAYLKEIDGRYAMWDLRIDTTDCLVAKFSVGPPTSDLNIFSCALLPGNSRRAGMIPEWERASGVFDRIEKFCPVLFNPSGAYATKRGLAWYRLYLNTEVRLRALNGNVLYSRDPFGPFDVYMGTLEDWEAGVSKWFCTTPQPHWKLPPVELLAPTPFHKPQ